MSDDVNAQPLRLDGQLYFTHLPELVAGGFRAAREPGAGWMPLPARFDAFSCVGLATGAHSSADELALDLRLTGWHRLHVAHNPALRIWLEDETGYCELPGDASQVREVAFPAADFTGRRLRIAPVRGAERSREVQLFYIRAEPCDGPAVNHRNLIVTNDGHGVFWGGMDTPRDLYRHLYPFREGDVFRMVWGLYGGALFSMRPDAKVAESPLRPDESHFYEGERRFNRSLRRLAAAGADPLAVVRAATREYGLELHFYCRMSAFYGPFPNTCWTTRFFKEHPQWRCRDERGNALNLMSYAWPQVQDHLLAHFDELLDYHPDGLCLAFNRGLPLMVCEEPVLEAYRRKHGRTPKLPEECDTPELLAVRHELLAGFVARVRRLVERRGKALSCVVPRDFARSRLLGLEAELLARRGLMECFMVGSGHGDDPSLYADLAPLRALKACGAKVYYGGSSGMSPGAGWARNDLRARAQRMTEVLDAGLDGGWFWDAEHVIGLEWESMRRFGDRPLLDRMARGEWPPSSVRATRAIHDLEIGRYNPWHAY